MTKIRHPFNLGFNGRKFPKNCWALLTFTPTYSGVPRTFCHLLQLIIIVPSKLSVEAASQPHKIRVRGPTPDTVSNQRNHAHRFNNRKLLSPNPKKCFDNNHTSLLTTLRARTRTPVPNAFTTRLTPNVSFQIFPREKRKRERNKQYY